MSVLSAKQNRTLTPLGKAAALLRIARRAESAADWLDEILSGDVMSMDLVDVPTTVEDRDRKRARASAACDELIALVNENPTAGWTREQRAYCRSQAAVR